jgi:hypothetical protein
MGHARRSASVPFGPAWSQMSWRARSGVPCAGPSFEETVLSDSETARSASRGDLGGQQLLTSCLLSTYIDERE